MPHGSSPDPGSRLATSAQTHRGNERPDWFDGAIERVLAGADTLTMTGSDRELDQGDAELVGAQLYGALQAGRSPRFGWWFSELVDATVDRIEQGNDPGWEASSGCCTACSEHAAEAWRVHAGNTDSTVAVVDDPADLRCLAELDTDEMLRGDEPPG
jgi:hypothetical protein